MMLIGKKNKPRNSESPTLLEQRLPGRNSRIATEKRQRFAKCMSVIHSVTLWSFQLTMAGEALIAIIKAVSQSNIL